MVWRTLPALVVALILLQQSQAGNWPQWRGPTLDGISPEKALPVSWDRQTNITWELALPEFSGSTPIIWGDSVFLNVADGTDLYLWCVDREKGELRWKRSLGQGNVKMRKQNMSSPSPVTDGQSIFVMTGNRRPQGIHPGRRASMGSRHPAGLRKVRTEPRLRLVSAAAQGRPLHPGPSRNEDRRSLLRPASRLAPTARRLWKVERPTDAIHESPDSYTTPTLAPTAKGLELVITGGDSATGHDPATGRELWRVNGFNPTNNRYFRVVASPVVAAGMIYVPTRVKPLMALRPGGRGDVSQSHRVWSFENGPDVPTPVSDGTYFYSVGDKGIMWCLDAKSGKQIWGGQRLRPGTYSSSPVLADGKIYVSNEDGVTSVVEAGPEFKILAENPLDDYCLSSPAISDGQIFIRTAERLFCIGKRRR